MLQATGNDLLENVGHPRYPYFYPTHLPFERFNVALRLLDYSIHSHLNLDVLIKFD
jgi:hypothetical protein